MRQGSIQSALKDRGHDLYETPPEATRALIATGCLDQFKRIFEPAAGRGAISHELKAAGFEVISHDLVAYEGADSDVYSGWDFFQARHVDGSDAIVTNPPFREADAFIRKGLKLGVPVIVLLRLMALEGARRGDVMQHLCHVFIGVERLPMMHRDGWNGPRLKQGAMPFGWFLFSPQPRQFDTFTASRISWREESNDELTIDSGALDAAVDQAVAGAAWIPGVAARE